MIVPMKRMTLVGMRADQQRVLSALQAVSVVQVLSTSEGEIDDSRLSALENQLQRLDGAIKRLTPFAPKAKLGPKPAATLEALNADVSDALAVCDKLDALEREIALVRADADKRRALVQSLEPWAEFKAPVESLRATPSVRYLTGIIAEKDLPRLEEMGFAYEAYGSGRERALLVAVHKDDYPSVDQFLKSLSYSEYTFPEITGTPEANILSQKQALNSLAEKEEALTGELSSCAQKLELLKRAFDATAILREREAAMCAAGLSDATFILDGWVREDGLEALDSAIKSVTDTFYLSLRDPAEGEEEPVALKNTPFNEPYEAVINLYSLPAPRTLDATALMAPFYILLFGMMLSDSGYGIVLAIGAYLFSKYIKPTGMTGGIAKVLYMGGISTVFCGLLFGSFFGMSWPEVFAGTKLAEIFPLIDPLVESIPMLGVCFGLGLVHMLFGVCIAVWYCIKHGDWAGAIVDNLTWFFIIVGLLLLASPMVGLPAVLAEVGKWMAIAGAVIVFLFAGRANKKIVGRLISGAGKLYNVTSWLSDVLSYARVFALSLSTGVVGMVLNRLGSMLYNAFGDGLILQAIAYIVTGAMLAGLHLAMIAINTLGCFVHTARLQYVEYFGKFYQPGGKPFLPLSYRTKHVRVTEK